MLAMMATKRGQISARSEVSMSSTSEAWVPTVGQRVRVLPRPTCRYCRGCDRGREDGAVGVVLDVGHAHPRRPAILAEDEAAFQAHRVWVRLSDPMWVDHFAVVELEPV
jgi:hypothetical protein